MHGFYRLAAAVPRLKIADVDFNAKKITELIKKAHKDSCSVILFPELSVTGYTCADLFHQPMLVEKALMAVTKIAKDTASLNIVSIVGAPFYWNSALYICAFVLHKGQIKGIVPKSNLPNYREYYEKRWFKSGKDIDCIEAEINGKEIPFGTNLFFDAGKTFKFAIEICEDMWSVVPPSSYHSIAGATVIFNLSASNDLVSKADYRSGLVRHQSASCIAGYVYTSSGIDESTTDLVYGGHSIITENGALLAENERFQRECSMITADIDCDRMVSARLNESSYSFSELPKGMKYKTIKLEKINDVKKIRRQFSAHPFVPQDKDQRDERCKEIFNIQAAGLAKRLEHTDCKKAVLGISGGLDSTLALLVIAETYKLLKRKPKDIITITMPGFGTTDRTYTNAVDMCKTIGTDFREIDIKDSCMLHFKDIGHDPKVHDVTYENVQARERMKVLMNIANKEKGFVIGTGDLSEIALGWSTYNADHMSMYAVNCSVPKTLIRYLIQWVADNSTKKLKKTLEDIIDTPVSPELLPNKKDAEINQKTEDILGPYELHDFFLYHTIKYGAPPEKIKYLAQTAFDGKYKKEFIAKVYNTFVRRFFSQQFKRSCIPDGPKVGTISLSPRGDWRMPSDASSAVWTD
jgi:NAD+ synthase (glutamine-hydrolysing)